MTRRSAILAGLMLGTAAGNPQDKEPPTRAFVGIDLWLDETSHIGEDKPYSFSAALEINVIEPPNSRAYALILHHNGRTAKITMAEIMDALLGQENRSPTGQERRP